MSADALRTVMQFVCVVLALSLGAPAVASAPAPVVVEPGASPGRSDNVRQLIKRSTNVVLVDFREVRLRSDSLEYRGEIVETLKGAARGTLVLRIPEKPSDDGREPDAFHHHDYDGSTKHAWVDFWTGRYRRNAFLAVTGVERGLHLVFLDELNHWDAVEPIFGLSDPWYTTVRAMIADPALAGRLVEPIVFLKMFSSVYLADCDKPGPGRKLRGANRASDAFFQPVLPRNDDDIANNISRNDAGTICKRWRSYLVLSTEPRDPLPISLPIQDGIVQFRARYFNLALTKRTAPLGAVMKELGRQ